MGLLREALRSYALRPTRRERLENQRKIAAAQQKGADESAAVRYWKKNSDTLEKLLKTAYEKIEELNDVLANHKAGDMQDRLINEGLKILPMLFGKQMPPINITPTTPTTNTTQAAAAETETHTSNSAKQEQAGGAYSKEELKSYFEQVPKHLLPKLAELPYDKFGALMKAKLPAATQQNILDAHEMVISSNEEKKENG